MYQRDPIEVFFQLKERSTKKTKQEASCDDCEEKYKKLLFEMSKNDGSVTSFRRKNVYE